MRSTATPFVLVYVYFVVCCCCLSLVSSGGVCAVLPQEGGEDGTVGSQEGPQKAFTGGGQSRQGQPWVM